MNYFKEISKYDLAINNLAQKRARLIDNQVDKCEHKNLVCAHDYDDYYSDRFVACKDCGLFDKMIGQWSPTFRVHYYEQEEIKSCDIVQYCLRR